MEVRAQSLRVQVTITKCGIGSGVKAALAKAAPSPPDDLAKVPVHEVSTLRRGNRGQRLTFSTTSLHLRRAPRRKRLLIREPLRPLAAGLSKRCILVAPNVDALLDGASDALFPTYDAERLFAEFSAGWLVTVSRQMAKRKYGQAPQIAQVVNHDEVWALCPRKPPPGWRILGRFYAKGIFVGLRAFDKDWLARRYETACPWVIDEWNEIFPGREPHRAATTEEYVSGLIRDVDEKE
jgi:hypothetical protein